MSICYYCARRLTFWTFNCRTCHCFSWRRSHVLILAFAALLTAYCLVWLVY